MKPYKKYVENIYIYDDVEYTSGYWFVTGRSCDIPKHELGNPELFPLVHVAAGVPAAIEFLAEKFNRTESLCFECQGCGLHLGHCEKCKYNRFGYGYVASATRTEVTEATEYLA